MEDVRKVVDEKRISRMPISRSESLDDTFGIVYVKDLFNLDNEATSVEVENLVKDAIYLPEYTTVLSALNILRENQASFACVIDENGGIEGVITIKTFSQSLLVICPMSTMKDSRESKGLDLGNGLLKVKQT